MSSTPVCELIDGHAFEAVVNAGGAGLRAPARQQCC